MYLVAKAAQGEELEAGKFNRGCLREKNRTNRLKYAWHAHVANLKLGNKCDKFQVSSCAKNAPRLKWNIPQVRQLLPNAKDGGILKIYRETFNRWFWKTAADAKASSSSIDRERKFSHCCCFPPSMAPSYSRGSCVFLGNSQCVWGRATMNFLSAGGRGEASALAIFMWWARLPSLSAKKWLLFNMFDFFL